MPANKSIEDEFYDEVLSSIENNKLGITLIKENDIFNLGIEITFEVLHVDNNEPAERNNALIVIELTYGEQQYLFMGDSEKAVEDKLLNSGSLEDIDVLKVGHHGSNTSITEQFANKVGFVRTYFNSMFFLIFIINNTIN